MRGCFFKKICYVKGIESLIFLNLGIGKWNCYKFFLGFFVWNVFFFEVKIECKWFLVCKNFNVKKIKGKYLYLCLLLGDNKIKKLSLG